MFVALNLLKRPPLHGASDRQTTPTHTAHTGVSFLPTGNAETTGGPAAAFCEKFLGLLIHGVSI
jgi:hypothetical protein